MGPRTITIIQAKPSENGYGFPPNFTASGWDQGILDLPLGRNPDSKGKPLIFGDNHYSSDPS